MICKSSLVKYCSPLILSLLCSTTGNAWHTQDSLAVDTAVTGIGQVLEGFVVTGQYAPTSTDKATHRIRIIDRQKIEAMNAQNLRDVLTNELNIRLSQDNVLGSGLSLQGISGQNVKILIDGVPVIGRLEGNIDISQINLNNIERIEVIEGPMSVSYGTDALAGTINLITKKTQNRICEAGITTYYESAGTYNIGARAGFKKKSHMVSLNGGRNFFDGWNPGDKQFNFDYSDKPADTGRYQQWKPKEQYFGDLQYGYRIKNTGLNYRGSYFTEKITNRGMPRQPYFEHTLDDYYRTTRIDNAVFMNTDIAGNKKLNLQAAYNQYRRTRNTYAKDLTTLEEIPSAMEGDQDTSKYNQFNSRGTFGTSAEKQKINYELGYDVNIEDASGLRITGKHQQIGDYALFASAEYKPWKDITIRPGLRYAYNTAYAAPLIPSVNIRTQPLKNVTIRASYAKGFRSPTLKELYFDFVDVNHDIHGNTALKAEYSDNYNAAVSYRIRQGEISWRLDGSVFYNHIRNQITLAQSGGNVEYTYVNIGINKTKGAQVNVEAQVKNLKAGAGGAYIARYNQLSEEAAGVTHFSYSPEVRGSLMYDFPRPGVSLSAFYKYTGRLPGFAADDAGTITATDIEAYHIADASVSKSLFEKQLNLTLGCKNIFDVQNVSRMAAGSTGGAHSGGGGSLPVGTGRTYFLKMIIYVKSQQ